MLALGAKKYILKAEYRLDEIITMMQDLIKDAGTATTGSSPEVSIPPLVSQPKPDQPTNPQEQ